MYSSHVTRIEENGAAVLRPVGEFDVSCVDILRAAILDALAESPRDVVDLSQTAFLDSMGVGAIAGGARRSREAGGWLRLVSPQPNVRKALSLTELDRVIGLYDTVDQAIQHADTDSDETANA
jgi:anti-sigma B factor antagonist